MTVFDASLLRPGGEAGAYRQFSEFVGAGRDAGEAFLKTAQSLPPAGGSPEEIVEALRKFAAKAEAAAPFIAGAPSMLESLHRQLSQQLTSGNSPDALLGLLGYPESPAAEEIRALYRVALEVSKEPDARQIVLDLSGNRAARQLESGFPELFDMIRSHLDDYGWVRTAGTRLEPLTTKEMMQRIQVALLRWDTNTIAIAAGEAQPPSKSGSPGEVPEDLKSVADACRTIAGDIAFGPALLVKARWLARTFFESVASAAGCSPSRLPFATAGEVCAALAGNADLPVDEMDLRAANGYTISWSGEQVEVRAGDTPADPEELAGQSVSLGRAVGRVKVVLDADEGGKLQAGDVLVTNLSTPNYEGQPSVFPYRTVPAVAVEKAGAILTDEGGLLSHAAIICRENQVPCILGTERATEMLKDGMIVEVDATRAAGKVTILG